MNGQRGVSGVSAIRAHRAVAGAQRVRSLLRWLRLTSGAQQEIAALDGLRALAVLLVVAVHVDLFGTGDWSLNHLPVLSGVINFGFTGVLLFFVLSGFLLFLPYARAFVGSHPWPSTRQFYRRRILRIVPVYYVVLTFMGVGLLAAGELQDWSIKGLAFDVLFLQNVSLDAWRVNRIDSALWTLALEWQFYVILPWFALGIATLCRPTFHRSASRGRTVLGAALALCGLIGCSLGIRLLSALVFYGNPLHMPLFDQGWFRLGLSVLDGRYLEDFALGMALSLLYAFAVERDWLLRRPLLWLGGLAALAALVGLVLSYQWADQESVIFGPGGPFPFHPVADWSWVIFGEWITTGCFTLLVGSALFGPVVIRRVFSVAPLRWIGIISYSMYIWHLPVIILVHNTGVALVIIFLVSFVSYYLIERPFLRRRYSSRASASARGSKSVPAPPASASPAHVG